MNKFLTIFLITIVPFNSFGQDEKISEIISSIAEELADDETNPEAVGIFIEKLNELADNPVSINSADETELSRLFFLTDFQIKSVANYIQSSGRIFSIYEIANIPGFNHELTEMIIPFIFLNDEKISHPDSVRLRNNFLTNFSIRHPVSDTSAPGSPVKLLTRYKFTAGRFSGGFTAEKDAGEKLFSGKPSLPDFMSANMAWTGNGVLRKIIAGDFGARFGLGTGINTGLRTGFSLTQPGYLSGSDEIKPYTSTDENIFFRGLAAQIQIRKTVLTLFLSGNKIDASVDSADNVSGKFVGSFYRSGLHNTGSSIGKKDALSEYAYGINLVSDYRNLRAGLLWTAGRFSIPVFRAKSDPESYFDFEGDRYSVFSAYYKAVLGKIGLFGEVSSNINDRFALAQGLSFRPADRISMNVLYRNYSPGFTAFHGKGLFSSSPGDNIRGIFGNLTFEAAAHLFVIAGCDLQYYPWLKYRCSAPSRAVNREIRIKYIPTDKLTVEAVCSYRFSMLDTSGTSGIKKQENIFSRSIKGTFRYSPDDNLTLTTRIYYKTVQPGFDKGMSLLQDISYRFSKIPVSVWLRYCIFNTESWDSRLYSYENDLLYSFSIPALSGKGTRSCIMIVWKTCKFIDIRVKYGITDIFGDQGTAAITEEFKVQARIRF
jgi:hypothetical protein